MKAETPSNEARMDAVLQYTKGQKNLFPFYFLDPTEPDAGEQVDIAVRKGIVGFKIICSRFFPCDARAMPVYQRIAALNKPILFHAGILFDGRNASGDFNRPCNFEGLLEIERLRFALAHAAWPWTDECLAVYGKFQNYLQYSKDESACEMFLDVCPGTPPVYRKALWERILFAGYAVKNNILYGIDSGLEGPYDSEYARRVVSRDQAIFEEFLVGEDLWDFLCRKNILRFLNLSGR